ncbi:MAG: acyl carrier protein [Nitrospiraceae bacterium]
MIDTSVQTRILQALGAYLKRDPSGIPSDAHLRDDLGLDSMATIELLYRVEEAFDLQIPDQDLQGLATVADVVAYVERRITPPESVASRPAASKPKPKSRPARVATKKKRG